MEDKTRKLQNITVILLLISLVLMQIKMNSYVRDMNSLWESQMELNRVLNNRIDLIQDAFLTNQSDFLDFLETAVGNFHHE